MAHAIWKGSISFGLLNIPVTLQTAGESKELHFQMLDSKDLAPIKYKKVNSQVMIYTSYKLLLLKRNYLTFL